jgi:hypothetical protein
MAWRIVWFLILVAAITLAMLALLGKGSDLPSHHDA